MGYLPAHAPPVFTAGDGGGVDIPALHHAQMDGLSMRQDHTVSGLDLVDQPVEQMRAGGPLSRAGLGVGRLIGRLKGLRVRRKRREVPRPVPVHGNHMVL